MNGFGFFVGFVMRANRGIMCVVFGCYVIDLRRVFRRFLCECLIQVEVVLLEFVIHNPFNYILLRAVAGQSFGLN